MSKLDEYTARKIVSCLKDHGEVESASLVEHYIDMFIKHDVDKVNLIIKNNPPHNDN